MLHRLVLLIALFVYVVNGDHMCCSPPQWESKEGFLTFAVDDEGHTAVSEGSVTLSFDATGKRIHLVENVRTGDKQQQYTLLQLYDQNVQYTIQNTTCTRSKATPWNDPNCVPGNATLTSKFRWGLNQSIDVSTYTWTEGALTVTSQITDGCVPVTSSNTGSLHGIQFITSQSMFDITVGIKDPSVFDIPAACKQEYVAEVNNPRQFFRR